MAVNEGNAGVTSAVLTLTLSTTSTSSVTVNYATAPGTATAGTDYTTASGTATFAAGTTTTTITVPVLGDTVVEPTETVLVNLTAPVNATIADAQGVVTITNDDTTSGLAAPWQTQDIGAVGLTGSGSFATATSTVYRHRRRRRHLGDGRCVPVRLSAALGRWIDHCARRDGAEHQRLGQGGRDDPRRPDRRVGAGDDDGDAGDHEGEQLPAPRHR